jgi:hypothetical protein
MKTPMSTTEIIGHTPLTDPRSLSASVVFHALVVLTASLVVLGGSRSSEPEPSRSILGEIDPVDNRAKGSGGEGGGSPGEIGNDRLATIAPPPSDGAKPSAARDPSADALLAEILPSPVAPGAVQQALPGPQTTSIGILPGPGTGTGGGGGSGGGMGGGIGRGIGPGTEFFGAREHAGSFAYVIDCSGSMATVNSLEVAKRELTVSLNRLPPDAQFAVIFYNLHATVFSDPQGHAGLMPATAVNKARVADLLRGVVPDGGTDHVVAVRTALALRPEVIFFLTDADSMTDDDVTLLLSQAGKTRIQAVEFALGVDLGGRANPLKHLATASGGSYRYIDVTQFAKRK